MKKILFATSECVPFIKTGGLADVAGALPKAFNKDEFDVRVILPNYLCIPEKYRNEFEYLGHFYLGLGGKFADTHCGVMRYVLDGITYYFIDNLYYFGGEKPYGDIRGDVEKFTFFSKAVLSVLKTIDFRPDLIHCHDWQAGFIPVYLKNQFADDPYYHNIKTVFTIHNLKFQGVWDIKTMQEISGFGDYLFTPDKLEYKKDANMLKGGLTYSDYITTVSETYAQEIQTEEYGEGMEGLLQARHFDMQGIVNGIDLSLYDLNTGEELDMGGPFDYFSEVSHPGYGGVSDEQYHNRMLLRDAMTASSGGSAKRPANIQSENGGIATTHCSARSAAIISVLRRLKAT